MHLICSLSCWSQSRLFWSYRDERGCSLAWDRNGWRFSFSDGGISLHLGSVWWIIWPISTRGILSIESMLLIRVLSSIPSLFLSYFPKAVSIHTFGQYWGAIAIYWCWSIFVYTSSRWCINRHWSYLTYGFWLLLLAVCPDRSRSTPMRTRLFLGVLAGCIADSK